MEKVWARHARVGEMIRAGIEAMGMKLLAAPGHRSNTVTAVHSPADTPEALKNLLTTLRTAHGLVLAGGQESLQGKIFRIGHLGFIDDADAYTILALLEAGPHRHRAAHARRTRHRGGAGSRARNGRPRRTRHRRVSIAAEPRTATGTVTRILVADPIAEDGVTRLRAAGEVDVMTGLEPSVLRERIGEYDALVVRSETKVTAEVFAAAPKPARGRTCRRRRRQHRHRSGDAARRARSQRTHRQHDRGNRARRSR